MKCKYRKKGCRARLTCLRASRVTDAASAPVGFSYTSNPARKPKRGSSHGLVLIPMVW
jgi:hypothetical protein